MQAFRHFYDLYFLLQDDECIEYIKTDFTKDLVSLIAHDKGEFDRPPLWKGSVVVTSPLFKDFMNLWNEVSPVYMSEVDALSYGTIPTSEEIFKVISKLFNEVYKIIEL